jgi:AcrR family transcriptional regulator
MPMRVDHNARRRDIADATLRVAARAGLEGVSIRTVAAEAGWSTRPVQYYFADKAALLAAAHARVTERLTDRITEAVLRLGATPEPRAVVTAIVKSFLPIDRDARDAMILYYCFYAAELAHADLRITDAASVPQRLATTIATQIRRYERARRRQRGGDPDRDAQLLVVAIPSIVSGVIAGYTSLDAAEALLDYAIDRVFAPSRRVSRASGS